jgi:hypothetical protein
MAEQFLYVLYLYIENPRRKGSIQCLPADVVLHNVVMQRMHLIVSNRIIVVPASLSIEIIPRSYLYIHPLSRWTQPKYLLGQCWTTSVWIQAVTKIGPSHMLPVALHTNAGPG